MYIKYIVLLSFLFSGCVSYDNFDTSKAKGAFGMAQALENDERYEEALGQYQNLKNRFPYSKYAVAAELQIAEIQYKREAYPEAQGAYQLFKELHPKHPKIDYVTYRIGDSIFLQLPSSIDRDLSMAPGAIKEFEVLLRDYPKSEHADEARQRKQEVINMLADKELYISDFYFRTEEWLHSIVRFEKYLKDFPTHGRRPHAFYRAGKAAEKLGDETKRNSFFRKLISDYPESSEAKKAKGVF